MAPQTNKREAEEVDGEEVCKRIKDAKQVAEGEKVAEAGADVVVKASGDDKQVESETNNNNNNNNKNSTSTNGSAEAKQQEQKQSDDDSAAAVKPEDESSAKVVEDAKVAEPVATEKAAAEADTKKADATNGTAKVAGEAEKKSTKESEAAPKAETAPKAEAAAAVEKKPEPEEEATEGVLLISGGANWDMVGRKELPKTAKKPAKENPAARNLWGPHKVHLDGKNLRVKGVFGGCNACHGVIVTDDGRVMTFGRNDRGQLGVGDTETHVTPVVVEALEGIDIVSAACGRSHTLFLAADGAVYSCGDNKMGQCGTNQQSVHTLTTPSRVAFKESKKVTKVACGAEFSMIIDEDNRLYSFGHPEHGQLGHNSEGKYFTTGNKYAYHCEYAPRRIVTYIEKSREGHVTPVEDVRITDVACGTNHTLAVDTKHRCFSWGFAGYHRLGHSETKNELVPRSIRLFDVPASTQRGCARVFAGATHSMALDCNGLLYFWGQNKSSGEATMYPKNVQDLCGWRINKISCANRSIVVLAEDTCISWGPSPTYGELGYGEGKAKSSTTPTEVKTLESCHLIDVACGFGHSLFIARDRTPEEKAALEKNFKNWP